MSKRVLSFHYILTNNKGDVIDTSRGGAQAFPVLEGAQQIIPVLETELFKMAVGDKKKVSIPAAQGYGVVREDLKVKVPKEQLPAGEVRVGMELTAGDHGPVFVVKAVEGDHVMLDGNHPLAGVDLTFDVEVTEVRPATEEEVQHGHAHGPNGHHHH